MAKERTYRDILDQYNRIRQKGRWDKKDPRQKRAMAIMDAYKKNIQRALGYSTYGVDVARNNIDRYGRAKSQRVQREYADAKNPMHAKRIFQGDRLKWQHNERPFYETISREERPRRNHIDHNFGVDVEDYDRKIPRSVYSGKSDAQYKAESDARRNNSRLRGTRTRKSTMAAKGNING